MTVMGVENQLVRRGGLKAGLDCARSFRLTAYFSERTAIGRPICMMARMMALGRVRGRVHSVNPDQYKQDRPEQSLHERHLYCHGPHLKPRKVRAHQSISAKTSKTFRFLLKSAQI